MVKAGAPCAALCITFGRPGFNCVKHEADLLFNHNQIIHAKPLIFYNMYNYRTVCKSWLKRSIIMIICKK